MEIKDSGARREFGTGAVRDIQEGKGRCDLMPLQVVSDIYVQNTDNHCASTVFRNLALFTHDGQIVHLLKVLDVFLLYGIPFKDGNWSTMFLEVSKHFEDGARKYGEHNWQKGIPTHCYVDSAIRHFLKWLRGDDDEPHDRAFVWNILCCIWTCENKPELNDYKESNNDRDNKN